MELSEILNYVLGGGVLALIAGVMTLKATVRKATAEAEKAKAEAESVRIDNAEHATRILIENIVEPLRAELHETRKELQETKKEFGSTKREIARFRKAVEKANSCDYHDSCPVLRKLRDQPKGDHSRGGREARHPNNTYRQHLARDPDSGDETDSPGGGEDRDTDGQPP